MPYGKTQKIKKNFSSITLSLASPESILDRSYGEVLKPETINYRSFKPEKDGLFCEKIFGPVKDWECHCGKYKRIRYKGIICDRCGVEVTQKSVRRERAGHITLSVPVIHIWYFKTLPNKIGHLLGLKSKELDRVIYYENYVVIQPGCASEVGVESKQLLTEDEYFNILYQIREDNNRLDDDDPDKFIAMIGGEAVEEMLRRVDLEQQSQELRFQVKTETSQQRKGEALKRLQVTESFREANRAMENRPEWMVMRVIPVIPPELRPLVPLEGGRFATSDLNDLYRRVIIRNNRLKRLIDIKAPEVILRNEKRMLQEAVDSLFDNSRKANAVRSDSNRALKSLSDMLKGKQGRFRQNLLGKRVDYSGRSVIVVGPELDLHECGLPKEMAVELFKPFIIRKLIERGLVKTVKSAKKVVDRRTPDVWDILEKVIAGRPVLLNRAPTLHRLGIQAFQPVLIEGKAIRLHPLVCTAFNADFDGDQMAVHVPLSHDACLEAIVLMLSSHNILSPAHGGPIAVPTQDMVLGLYYMTKARTGVKGEGMRFASMTEARQAFDQGVVGLHARIKVRDFDGELIDTTIGRVLFNEGVPAEAGFINEVLTKKNLRQIISRVLKTTGSARAAQFLDAIKRLGFESATTAGLTFSLSDIVVPNSKEVLISDASSEVEKARANYEMGFITENERYNQVIDIWTRTNNRVSDVLFETLKNDREGFNAIYMMADSGARGSKEQIRQLGGMRGLMAKPQRRTVGEEVIETPIKSSFREGLSVWEYFISTHGARKGLTDTALKTAEAGYLTRRLVDAAQDVVITMEDCGTILGQEITALREGGDIVEPLSERIAGRFAVDDIVNPVSGEVVVEAGEEITDVLAQEIEDYGIEQVRVRSVLTCDATAGLCGKCYGRNLATGKMVEIGEAVGIIAAQSIGEPGTQLTLKTFHVGGVASRVAEQTKATARVPGKVKYEGLKTSTRSDGEVVALDMGRMILTAADRAVPFNVPAGAVVRVKEGQEVQQEDILFEWEPYSIPIMARTEGKVVFHDIEVGITVREDIDDRTERMQRIITEDREKKRHPHITVVGAKGKVLETHALPAGAYLVAEDKQKVQKGDTLARLLREMGRTRDITGGLPKVAELFEAKRVKDPAMISEIDGTTEVGTPKEGIREVRVISDGGATKQYRIPYGKYLLVQTGDSVRAGDKLCEGSVDPHDVLAVRGWMAVQEFLTNQIQAVYRLQKVSINDKHIAVIVKQMLRKVKVLDAGDSNYIEGEIVERRRLLAENQKLAGENLRPASYQPILLGITRAALLTESFLSAASFQETTRVLSEASIQGRLDGLNGLKENVIVGRLVPAGTGFREFNRVVLATEESEKKDQEAV